MQRGSGILLHITSLPSEFGIGDLGPGAYRFIDFLAEAKQKYWQILPLTPTEAINHHSPYSGISAFAGNPLLISPELLVKEGWCGDPLLKDKPLFSERKVKYDAVLRFKSKLLSSAYQRSQGTLAQHADFKAFCEEHKAWLDDFAFYVVLKEHFGHHAFHSWPQEFRDRKEETIKGVKSEFAEQLTFIKWQQYVFMKQWLDLKAYAGRKGVKIIGDIPIYVNDDSADVWAHPEYFLLDENRQVKCVAGVPPDYFSETGQRWGNPIYDWEKLKQTGYAWWIDRLKHNLLLYDYLRIDHFRGFAGFWQIPAHERLAIHGEWKQGPGHQFFDAILKYFPQLPLIAEDLGVITPDVKELIARYHLPGMKVLLFAFGDDIRTNPYIPENFGEDAVVYTGTHDNDTARGWFEGAPPKEKENLFAYIKRQVSSKEVPLALIELAMRSKAAAAIFPMQDVLGLGKRSRMNTPGTLEGNWQWRLAPKMLKPVVAKRLAGLTQEAQRA